MQALEVGHFGSVTGFDQGFITRFDEFHRTTAQHGLLTEKVGLSFLTEVGFDHTCTGAADCRCVRKRQIARLLRDILMHRDQHGYTTASGVGGAYGVARGFGGNHHHVQIGARGHLAVMHVKSVGKAQHCTLLDVRLHVTLVGRGDALVGHQHHHKVCAFDSLSNFSDLEASLFDLVPRGAAFAYADGDFHAGVVQVLCVGMAL